MRGRLGDIKKTNILRFLLFLLTSIFITFLFLNIFIIPIKTLWFYAFCLCVGIFEMAKSRLFKLDSSFYFGSLLFFSGASCFIFTFTNTSNFWYLYLLFSFFLASFFTFIVTGQKFHLVFDYSLLFVIIFSTFFTFSLITLPYFIAFLLSFLVLFILIMVLNFKRREK